MNAESGCYRVEADSDLDGKLSLTWHRRQSQEQRLADVALQIMFNAVWLLRGGGRCRPWWEAQLDMAQAAEPRAAG